MQQTYKFISLVNCSLSLIFCFVLFLGYDCNDWETDSICYPQLDGNSDGTRQSNRTCKSLVEPYNDTIQILTENCTFDAGLSVNKFYVFLQQAKLKKYYLEFMLYVYGWIAWGWEAYFCNYRHYVSQCSVRTMDWLPNFPH